MIGGTPKSCKTWLALDIAVSVASGTPAFGRFAVETAGPVVFFGAEDDAASLARRVAGIAAARGILLGDLDLHFINTPRLLLDDPQDLRLLREAVGKILPTLLVLDPLVRLHRGNENNAGKMSALLGDLRTIQREHHAGIILTHHTGKRVGRGGPDGQALRGSGDLHAWGDSNLYLGRQGNQIRIVAEHRAAPAPQPIMLELMSAPAPHLAVIDAPTGEAVSATIQDRLLAALAEAQGPSTQEQLRKRLQIRKSAVVTALGELQQAGLAVRVKGGYSLGLVPVPEPTHT